MSLVKADDACPQVRFGVSIIPTDVRDGSIASVERYRYVGFTPDSRRMAATQRTDASGQQGTWPWSRQSLVYPPALHNNLKVLGGVGDQFDVLQRIALDQQQIGKRALFHDAELPCIRTTLAGQCK